MKKARFTEEQIIGIQREHEAGAATADVWRRHGVSSATFYKWKAKYGGLEMSDARRMRSLEDESRSRRTDHASLNQGTMYRPGFDSGVAGNSGRSYFVA